MRPAGKLIRAAGGAFMFNGFAWPQQGLSAMLAFYMLIKLFYYKRRKK